MYKITSEREATSGFEPLVQLLQSRALPLGDVATYARLTGMERETGIEPATFSLARRCSTTEPLPLNAFATIRYHIRACLSIDFPTFQGFSSILFNREPAFFEEC
jgi:hypothetical protein